MIIITAKKRSINWTIFSMMIITRPKFQAQDWSIKKEIEKHRLNNTLFNEIKNQQDATTTTTKCMIRIVQWSKMKCLVGGEWWNVILTVWSFESSSWSNIIIVDVMMMKYLLLVVVMVRGFLFCFLNFEFSRAENLYL